MVKAVKQRRPKELTVSISRTVQIKQYHPVTVSVKEVHELEEGESVRTVRTEVYNQIGSALASYMDHELKRYKEEDD